MSKNIVRRPPPAPAEPVASPSQSARPGSLKCTCASRIPGRARRPSASVSWCVSSFTLGAMRTILPRTMPISTSCTPSGVTTRPPRTTKSSFSARESSSNFPGQSDQLVHGPCCCPILSRKSTITRNATPEVPRRRILVRVVAQPVATPHKQHRHRCQPPTSPPVVPRPAHGQGSSLAPPPRSA